MRTLRLSAVAVAALVVASACSDAPVAGGREKVELKIVSVSPDSVFVEGGELVTVTTENGCRIDQLTAKVRDVTLSNVQEIEANKYTFSSPPLALTSPSAETLTFTCAAHPEPETKEYAAGKNTASATLSYDPRLEPAPTVRSYGPVGDRISVLAKMAVTFSRDMDPSTITKDTVFIQGVDGEVDYNVSTRTATVTPKEQLGYGETFTCIVKGGQGGVTSKATGKALKTTLKPGGGTPDPDQDAWTFTTRQEGEGNPWVGDISAAAGIATGGNYKLFSVTGQPTPVGEAIAGSPENPTYKLQAGFIYATQPPSSEE